MLTHFYNFAPFISAMNGGALRCIEGKIKFHWDMQNKHIPGSHNFDSSRGIVTIDPNRLQKLLSERAGWGQRIPGELPYRPGYRERIEFGEIIGEYVLLNEKEEIITKASTTKGVVHYSKRGVHVVPSNPNAK